MLQSWKDCIYRQREQLAHKLREPLTQLGEQCAPAWGDKEHLNRILLDGLATVPHCTWLYVLATDGMQLSDNIGRAGIIPGHYAQDRSQRPYMKEQVPAWGFLLSDAYISILTRRPSLTALQVVRSERGVLGYLVADFDLRDLPVTSDLYEEPGNWQQIKGDPAIRSTLFQQTRVETPMDRNLDQAMSILEELLTERGIFQCQIRFSSSQATIWTVDDPFRYRTLDHEAMTDPDICLVYPHGPYADNALTPRTDIPRVLDTMKALRLADETIYLRMASINLFNGMVSLTFSCDGTQHMRYDELLQKDRAFWFGNAA
ncbi:PDC sensor domain-containing protein [Pseudomonadota bacterium]